MEDRDRTNTSSPPTEGGAPSTTGGGEAPPTEAANPAAAPSTNPKVTRKELRRQLRASQKEAKGFYNQLLHVQADYENLKKRLIREREDYIRQAKEALVKELLPSLDNLEYALRHAREHQEQSPLLNGVEMMHKGLLGALRKFGVVPVEALGAVFDPNFHEAIARAEREDGRNQVVEEHQRGYLLDGRLLRPALVTIAVPPAPPAKSPEST